ncbi:hypothetical protein D9613_011919 [Agrocybe pediades]|uniref:Uncharacterized protein n=1 Tax=Agrocybe pediades TaxID=84607 RepID=A0A8H4QEZ0_9AGAR|nr:hypothetical protein D9613_011919 [Agrocybe pediades]
MRLGEDGMDFSRYIPTNPALQVIIDSDDKECNGIRTDSVQSSWTSSKGRKDVDTAKRRRTESNNSHVSRPRYGMRITSTTYFEKVKNIGARWRRTDLDSCGSGDMLWLDVIDVLKAGLDKLPYKYHRRVNFLPFL